MGYGANINDRRNQAAAKMAENRDSVREIGSIPAVSDIERKEKCCEDLGLFLKTYMPATFSLPWSPDHKLVIEKIQKCIMGGGLFSEAMPRGSGKTQMCAGAALWGALYGHRRYIVLIGAKAGNTREIQEGIMTEVRCNDMLYDDFPEVCHAVRHIDGIGQRAAGQTYKGKPTHIRWNKDGLRFPMIPDSKSAGVIIEADGLGSAIRGKHFKLSDGTTLRPDLVLLDDPQTEDDARSVTQCDKLEDLIEKAVLGLGGPDVKISALMACTIIEKHDLSDRYLDHKRHPEWRGECFKMVYKWPDEQEGMWEEYADMRRGEKGGDNREEWEKMATEYYRENQEAMDAGAEVAWAERLFKDEISALQNAENLLIDRGKIAFFSEYQNDPQEAQPALYKIEPEIVMSKVNHTPRMQIPKGCAYLVGFADVNINERGINWVVAGFMGDMTGFVVDYGKHPEGLKQAVRQKDEAEDRAVFRGLKEITGILAAKQYVYEGRRIPIQLLMFDCSYQMTTVFRFVDWATANAPSLAAGIKGVVCSRGRDSKRYRPSKPIGRPGNGLHLTEFVGKGKVLIHDVDYWRVHAQKSFLLPVGAPGSLSLYGDKPEEHKRFGNEMCAEILVEFLKGDIADSYNWHYKPGVYNDLCDSMVGCCVAASFAGATVDGEYIAQQPRKQKPQFKQHNI